MQKLYLSRLSSPDKFISRLTLLAAIGSTLFLSPKWLSPVAAWISPFLWLYFFASCRIHGKWVWGFISLVITQLLATWEVNPFPLPILITISLVDSLKTILVYAVVAYGFRKFPYNRVALLFPVMMTAKEYIESFGGGGTWSSIAYSQYSFKWLVQLVSVTGIWGITFLIYWFASVLYILITKESQKKLQTLLFAGIFSSVLISGSIRYYHSAEKPKTLITGGLTVPQTGLMESVYKDHFKEVIRLPAELNQSSPVLSKVNSALGAFIENPDSTIFPATITAMNRLYDSLFSLSSKLADAGARLVLWSEGNAMILRSQEDTIIQRGRELAKAKGIHLLMTLASFEPGKIYPGKKFLQNKTLLIGPDGDLLNTFHKNKPVPFIEPTVPGDGTIPVIQTSAGKISPSICYDADFPELIRQAGKKNTELLLLPSGDWRAISPYHTYMAVFRAVENGFSLVRQVNNGYSVAVDYRGREYGSMDYFKSPVKIMIAEIPIQHIPTFYTYAGDILAIICLIISVGFLGWILMTGIRIFLRKRNGEFKKTDYIHQ